MSLSPQGALLIDKPKGISSFDIIDSLSRAVRDQGFKRSEIPKMGHGGTLDPFATGLIPVFLGRAAKVSRYYLGSRKRYRALMRFGITSQSGDITDPVVASTDQLPESLDQIKKAALSFVTQPYPQIPPMHSAKKKDGVPLYELARQGITIDREPKLCTIFNLGVESYQSGEAWIDVDCSSGTYIRVLAQDLAERMGSKALLVELRRLKTAGLTLDQALPLDTILNTPFSDWSKLSCFIAFDRLLDHMEKTQVSEAQAVAIRQGKQYVLNEILGQPKAHSKLPAAQPDSELPRMALYLRDQLVAVTANGELERVF